MTTPNPSEEEMTEPSGSPSTATLAAITTILVSIIAAITFLSYSGAEAKELIQFLSFIPSAVITLILLRKQETAKDVLDKVERNTNGNLSALIEKINHVPEESVKPETEG